MPSIEDLFRQSKGKPVVYNGRVIQMVHQLNVPDGNELRVTFEAVNADWRQGIFLSTDGGFLVNNQTIRKSVVLWHDTAPTNVRLQIQTKKGECRVKNVWDTGDGVMHSSHNGAAMIVEDIPSGWRYQCNEGRADDDFDDIIFQIEVIGPTPRA